MGPSSCVVLLSFSDNVKLPDVDDDDDDDDVDEWVDCCCDDIDELDENAEDDEEYELDDVDDVGLDCVWPFVVVVVDCGESSKLNSALVSVEFFREFDLRRNERRLNARNELSKKNDDKKLDDNDLVFSLRSFDWLAFVLVFFRSDSITEGGRDAADDVGDETDGVDELSLLSTNTPSSIESEDATSSSIPFCVVSLEFFVLFVTVSSNEWKKTN